jgi:hypothetical protein
MNARVRRTCVAKSIGILGTLALALGPACKQTPTLAFSVSVPGDVASQIAWFEVGVFAGSVCASIGPQLTAGVPTTGFEERIAFSATQTPQSITNLPRASYSIAVAARGADCSVVAAGCSNVDLSSNTSVSVTLDDAPTPTQGACINGAVCDEAKCSPGVATVGAGCSLELLGAGPLADPLLLGGGTIVSAPAVAATDDGFLVAYREDDTGDGVARITVIPIDEAGGAGTPQQTQEAACSAAELSDATGLAFSGTSGVVAEARAGCGGSGGIDLYSVNDTGTIGSAGFTSEGAPRALFSTAHALTSSSAGTFVAYVESNVATVGVVNGLAVGATTSFSGANNATNAWIAASNSMIALVASSGSGTNGGGEDASAPIEAGEAGGTEDAGALPDDAGPPSTSGSELRVNIVAASGTGASFASLPAAGTFAGTWASVSAQEGRAFVASDGQTTAQPIVYRAFDVGSATPNVATVTGGFATADVGPVLYADVAFHQDHVFFAVESQGAIALVAFDNASTTPTALRTVELADDPRIPSISAVRDGRVAVLATDTRVLVAWTTEESITFNDATGGYALFACTTP